MPVIIPLDPDNVPDVGLPVAPAAEKPEYAPPSPTIFSSPEFGDIRIIMEDGKPLFCAKDVAAALGYADTSKAIKAHCRREVKRPLFTSTGKKELSFIPESDVYRLVMRSKLPSAERFQDWVVEEVLPTIRETGRFEIAPGVKQYTMRESLMLNLELWDKNEEQARIIEEKSRVIFEQAPVVQYHKDYIESESQYLPRDVSHHVGMPERKFIAMCEELKILYRPCGPGTRLKAYGEFYTAGFFSAKPRKDREIYPMEVLFTPLGLA